MVATVKFYEQTIMPEMRKSLLYLFFLLVAGSLGSQDLHYSQFYNSPLNANPGKTGIFNGDKRVNLSYRSQWRSVPVPWTTFSGSFDRKFYPKYNDGHFFSAGVLFNYDVQGELSDINLANIDVAGSWTKVINENNLFTIGALVGYATRGFDINSLTFDSQWNGVEFDPNLSTNENFNTQRLSFLETGLGINYRWQESKRTKLDIGLGSYHIFEPDVAYNNDDEVRLPRRFTLTGSGSFQLSNKLDLQVNALGQKQGDYGEVILSGLGKIHVNQDRGKELEFHVGLGWRSGKSLFPIVAVQHRQMYVSLNYDIDLTDFGNSVNQRRPTSFEVHFNYIVTDVRRRVKVCPIY